VGSLLILIIILLVIIPEKETLVWLHRKIMLTFSSMSLSLFGGGYVAVPSMHKIIVDTLHWLTNKEFVDAIALGQVTPGPILVSATFIGYKLAGFFGALNATLSIFLPTAILMVICSRFLAKINNAPALKAAFKGLRPAIIGMILSAAVTILVSTGISYKTIILFLAILAVVIKYNPDTVFIIPVAGVIGLILL
jgi:chromate transporter